MASSPRKSSSKKKSNKLNKNLLTKYRFIAFAGLFAIIGVAFVFQSQAARYTCNPGLPEVRFSNSYEWGPTSGSWATHEQAREFPVGIYNYDCQQATYDISVKVPEGFTAVLDRPQITLAATLPGKTVQADSVGLLVTSPKGIADGNYTIEVTVQSTTKPSMTAAATAFYKLYSSDTSKPYIGATNPFGTFKASRATGVWAHSYDDHQVKLVEYYIDGKLMGAEDCTQEITYACDLHATWDSTRAIGTHTFLYKSTDMFGNSSTKTEVITVTK